MTYLLDTAVCIGFMRNTAPKTIAKIEATPFAEMVLCSIVVHELLVGVERCRRPVTERPKVEGFIAQFRSLPFDDEAGRDAARIRAVLESQGVPTGANDLLIAGIARIRGLILVTPNIIDFKRIPDLQVQNWES
jgi:tRNA(fMet)-specific endonuclease VapC